MVLTLIDLIISYLIPSSWNYDHQSPGRPPLNEAPKTAVIRHLVAPTGQLYFCCLDGNNMVDRWHQVCHEISC